ncbi:MAG TPA: c-type cytochrome, partial [Puia sp.]
GASFVASRIFPNREFLTSTDAWSRPVNLYTGPDGALYVLDYYRRVIESPEWMSAEAIAAGGLYDGSDKGRIYRITAAGAGKADWTKGLQLGSATNEELVKNLANPNEWWRINAQRLLVDRADKSALPALISMAMQQAAPLGRLHALWTLEGMNALTADLIKAALKDSVAGIRENAIRLAERHLSAAPDLAGALLPLQTDPDAKVRFQLLLTLGYLNTPEAVQARNRLLFKDINDKWVQVAALSAPASQTASLLGMVLEKFRENDPAYASLVQRLTTMAGASAGPEDIHRLIQKATDIHTKKQAWQAPILEGLTRGMKNRKPSAAISDADQHLLVKTFFENPSGDLRRASLQLLKLNGISNSSLKTGSDLKAVSMVKDTGIAEERRADAIDWLALYNPSAHVLLLEKLLVPQEGSLVQLAALRVLNQVPSDSVSRFLIQQWPVLTKEIRDEAIGVLVSKPERIALLIDALEKGKILTSSVSFDRSVQLMMMKDDNLRNRARALFTKNETEAKEINKSYQAALELNGDPLKGKQIYLENCARCHTVRGKLGISFGPDLGTIHNWKKEDILANILNPSLSIAAGYELWEAELKNNETVQGIIASETTSAITLKNSEGNVRTISRQDIRSLKSLNISAMTPGLEKKIDKQQMADILAFLRQN